MRERLSFLCRPQHLTPGPRARASVFFVNRRRLPGVKRYWTLFVVALQFVPLRVNDGWADLARFHAELPRST